MISTRAAMIALVSVFMVSTLAGCSKDRLVEHKRDKNFFEGFVNSAVDFNDAEAKLQNLKLIESTEIYNMRYALFDNGKFYYQVDKLGEGTGQWTFNDGAITLFAKRSFFDLDLLLTATAEKGERIGFIFLDRFGTRSATASFRDGQAASKPLSHFTFDSRGI